MLVPYSSHSLVVLFCLLWAGYAFWPSLFRNCAARDRMHVLGCPLLSGCCCWRLSPESDSELATKQPRVAGLPALRFSDVCRHGLSGVGMAKDLLRN